MSLEFCLAKHATDHGLLYHTVPTGSLIFHPGMPSQFIQNLMNSGKTSAHKSQPVTLGGLHQKIDS